MRPARAMLVLFAIGCATSTELAVDASPSPDAAVDEADSLQFCTDEHTFECARDFAAGRIDMAGYNTCAGQVDATCLGFAWPSGCHPTREIAGACIDAVSDALRLATPTAMIVECAEATLCAP